MVYKVVPSYSREQATNLGVIFGICCFWSSGYNKFYISIIDDLRKYVLNPKGYITSILETY